MANTPKFHGTPIIEDKNGKTLRPITRGQQQLLEAIETNDIVFVNGPAGTGKTCVATWYAIAGIDAGLYEHLVLTRPIVEAGEELGFLPGTFEEKVAPYMQPLYEAIEMVKGKQKPKPTLDTSQKFSQQKPFDKRGKKPTNKKGYSDEAEANLYEFKSDNSDFYSKVNVCPLAYLRGSTKAKSFIILDEAQNVTSTQMKMMLTRLGYGSKLVICGDINQSDLESRVKSGFREAQNLLKKIKGIGFVTLNSDDIVRHRLIKDIILRYEGKDSNRRTEVHSNRNDIENIRDLRNYDFSDDGDAEDDDVTESPDGSESDGIGDVDVK